MLVAVLVPAAVLAFAVVARSDDDDAPPASSEEAHQRVRDSIALQVDFATRKFPSLGLDLADLPRTTFMSSYVPPFETLEDTVEGASTIAYVRVSDVAFTDHFTARITADVLARWKGTGGSVISFEQIGSVYLIDDEPTLVEAEVSPLLLPGDRAVVFLHDGEDSEAGVEEVIISTGWYRVDATGLVVLPEQPADDVKRFAGVTVDELRAAVVVAAEGEG
jgi:hypothetical protein